MTKQYKIEKNILIAVVIAALAVSAGLILQAVKLGEHIDWMPMIIMYSCITLAFDNLAKKKKNQTEETNAAMND